MNTELKRKATISDVANLAGVSIKTVSRVVNREPNVSQSTRHQVEDAITRLNYRPNLSARNLASQRSHLLVLVYDDPGVYENPSADYILRLQQGALHVCGASGYELLIHPCNFRNQDVCRELAGLIERTRPDGILLAAPLSNMSKLVDCISATETAFLRLSPGIEDKGQASIETNDREISAEMTRYLASLGHERIAFITGDPDHKAVANRYLGYQDGLAQSGLALAEALVPAGDNSLGSGEKAATELLGLEQPPTAIFAANDDMAVGALRVAYRLGIEVPGRLSVAGFDDNSLARQIYPTLTTVRQPLATMAETAARLLIENFGKELSLAGPNRVPASLQIRESTGPAPDPA